MQCGDGSGIQQNELAFLFLVRQSLGDCLSYALAHFAGGGIGEGDNENFVDVAVAADNVLYDAFHQYGGFAGTGGGRDENVFTASFYGSVLMF